MSSTFCAWPALAAVGRGVFVASPVWPNARSVAAGVPRFRVADAGHFVSYDTLPRGLRKRGRERRRHPGFTGNCTTGPPVVRAWVRAKIWPPSIRPPDAAAKWASIVGAEAAFILTPLTVTKAPGGPSREAR
jgi:hypothetical protein